MLYSIQYAIHCTCTCIYGMLYLLNMLLSDYMYMYVHVSSWVFSVFFVIFQVISRTLQNPNTSRYRRLVEGLFSQQNPRLMELTFYMDSKGQDSKRGFDKVRNQLMIR